MSVCSRLRKWCRVWRESTGSTAIEFAIMGPVILLLTAGILESMLLLFDYHRATEATRRGARLASYQQPVAELDSLDGGATVICSSAADVVNCGGATLFSVATFTAVLAEMREIVPQIQQEDLEIVYAPSNIGDITTPGGLKPQVTVRITGVVHEFILFGGFSGLPLDHQMPSFSTTVLGIGYQS